MANAQDIDTAADSDLLSSANDAVRRALDEAAAGEATGKLVAIGAGTFAFAALIGFIGAAAAIKVLR